MTADTLNTLLLNCMFASGQLKEGEMYDADFTHQVQRLSKAMQSLHTRRLLISPWRAVIDDLTRHENSDVQYQCLSL